MLRQGERREIELRHKAELWEREQRLAEIVESALDAIVTFDADERITLFNAAAERMFGARATDVLGESARRFFPGLSPDFLEQACSPRLGGIGGPSASDEIEAFVGRRANGEELPIEASISCLDLPSGRLYTVIGRDVSERKRAEAALRSQAISLANTTAELQATNEELNRRQVELERAMNARSRFYASMSHELRTPINAILGYNTLMLEHIYGPLTEKQREGLERTQKAARHLLELVNDVLDLSKIEAGKIELKPQPVRFPGLIEDLFVTVRPMADQRGTQLSLHHEGEPFSVTSDPRRVRQILLNLLSNAIKFGRGRPIRVESCPTPSGGIEIAVIDQGEGIAAEDLPRIFDEFVQLSAAGKAHHEGTGLGLPISKRLATLLHGRLEVTSQLGVGSTFRLVLPRELDARTGTAASTEAAADRAASRADGSGELAVPSRVEPMGDVRAEPDSGPQTEVAEAADAAADEPTGESRSGAGV
jgi:PAS domain S-box-containing protein